MASSVDLAATPHPDIRLRIVTADRGFRHRNPWSGSTFPTHVGVIRLETEQPFRVPDLPHTRGGYPAWARTKPHTIPPSPHTWGLSIEPGTHCNNVIPFPTRVGVIPQGNCWRAVPKPPFPTRVEVIPALARPGTAHSWPGEAARQTFRQYQDSRPAVLGRFHWPYAPMTAYVRGGGPSKTPLASATERAPPEAIK